MLPSITNVINLADSHDRAAFAMATHVKQEPRERENSETKEEVGAGRRRRRRRRRRRDCGLAHRSLETLRIHNVRVEQWDLMHSHETSSVKRARLFVFCPFSTV